MFNMTGKDLALKILALPEEEQNLPITFIVSNHTGKESHISIIKERGYTSLFIGDMTPWRSEHEIIKKII